MAHARAPLDGRDAKQEGQHGTLPSPGLGLDRNDRRHSEELGRENEMCYGRTDDIIGTVIRG